jgi:phage terminase small subunit
MVNEDISFVNMDMWKGSGDKFGLTFKILEVPSGLKMRCYSKHLSNFLISLELPKGKKKADHPLSAMELSFCYEYIACKFDQKKAAINAGYSEHTATVQASQLLTRLNVQRKIKELTEKYLQTLTIRGEDIIKELSILGFARLEDFIDWDPVGGIKMKTSDMIGERSAAIQQITIDEDLLGNKSYKIRLHDKSGPLQVLAKHIKLIDDKSKDTGPLETTTGMDLSNLSDTELLTLKKLTEKACANTNPAS